VVVNDGSGDAFDALFRSVARLPNLCEHAINLAKGAALRTAMHVCLTPSVTRRGSSPSTPTVNTTPRTPAASAIGSTRSLARWSSSVRWFLGTVRLRSRIGNILTRWLWADRPPPDRGQGFVRRGLRDQDIYVSGHRSGPLRRCGPQRDRGSLCPAGELVVAGRDPSGADHRRHGRRI
jgi:hypothetical protein